MRQQKIIADGASARKPGGSMILHEIFLTSIPKLILASARIPAVARGGDFGDDPFSARITHCLERQL
jgi:hypothetical protein